MNTTLRFHTEVLPGHRIEISSPQLSEGASVDVLVVPSEEAARPVADRRQILRMPLEQRRRLLMVQAERLAAYYETDTDRLDWQAGDIIE